MKLLCKVAEAMGPERTRKELVSFLSGECCLVVSQYRIPTPPPVSCLDQLEDDDEVLLVMAGELGKFVPLVGGVHESVVLIPLLGSLAMIEETVVRDKVSDSLLCCLHAAPGL